MGRKIDITGKRFGRLVAKSFITRRINGKLRTYWECVCDCGNTKLIVLDCLNDGRSQSCGCLHKEFVSQIHYKHGQTGTSEYVIWKNIKSRCFNPTNKKYHAYGGRGITMHPSWVHDFEQFIKDVGIRPRGTSLDRINNDGNYEPSNCRWATIEQQSTNTRQNVRIEYNGESKTVGQWARSLCISSSAFFKWRVTLGLTMSEIETKANGLHRGKHADSKP